MGPGGSGARALGDDEEPRRIAYPAPRGDPRPTEAYRCAPGAPLTCPPVAIGGDRDGSVTPGGIAQRSSRFPRTSTWKSSKCEGLEFAGSVKVKAATEMVDAKEHKGELLPSATLIESS